MEDLSFKAKLRLWSNGKKPASWHFVSVNKKVSEKIKKIASEKPRKGFGSVKVKVRIGFLTRETSIFPDSKRGVYVLPIKKSVREELKIEVDDEVLVNIELL